MKNWKIALRISLAFAVVILICAAMSFFNYNRVQHIDSQAVNVSDNTVPSVIALSKLQTNMYRNLELIRQHADTSSQAEMDRLDTVMDANREQNTKSLKEYEALPTSSEEAALYAKVTQDRAAYWALIAQIRKHSREGAAERNLTVQMINTQLLPTTERLTDEVQAVVDFNNKGSKEGLHKVREAVSSTVTGTIIGLLLAIAMASLIAFVLVRGITSPLAKTVAALVQVADGDLTVVVDVDSRDEVGQMANALNRAVERLNSTLQEVAESAANATSSSQQLAAAAEAISSGAQEQAASLEETSASLEEITAAVRQSADNANQASQLATSSKDSA